MNDSVTQGMLYRWIRLLTNVDPYDEEMGPKIDRWRENNEQFILRADVIAQVVGEMMAFQAGMRAK